MGDFLFRMQAFLSLLLSLSEKHRLAMELVIVEWNPPPGNPPLKDALKWPDSLGVSHVRIIQVPESAHRQFPHSERMGMFEFIGKNVGARRAKGEYILVTNPDILFTDQIMKFLADADLSERNYYRATRYDVQGPVPCDVPPQEILEYCKQHITRINAYPSSFDNRLSAKLNLYRMLYDLADYVTWRVKYFPFERPFTNASGDFLMMHSKHWHALRGYPQIIGADSAGYFHMDSVLVCEALFQGLKQVRLGGKSRIYHQEHPRKRDIAPFSKEIGAAREQLLKAQRPVIFNDEMWGLGAFELPEITVI
jgi:hypothetical protein